MVDFQALLCILKERLFYLWCHMKTIVYETKVDSRAALRRRIFAAAEQIQKTILTTLLVLLVP